ncbi:replication-relaxation family protein [Phaeobacter inhibens]|uniref:replication-relaxation family protein n=1 Tax=Phaeobacter inhibens TaxID=221822 RepID=UPI0018D2544F|nr:replication-relaxation family protein [Phaeobacter inhibens]WHP67301.1 replication-relaxation family protein [Phaeobacter inhibens]
MTPRDQEILSWLYRYRYLRHDHLIRIFAPKSPKRFAERLGDLFHETGFINRPLLQAPLFDARATPMMYEISNKGVTYLEALKLLPHRAVTFSRRPRDSFNPQMLHTMMIVESLLEAELATQPEPDQRFVPVDEILARAPEATQKARNPLALPARIDGRKTQLIPDALYGIEYQVDGESRYRFYALECERTSPAFRSGSLTSSTRKKKAAYAAAIQMQAFRAKWGIPNLEVRFREAKKTLNLPRGK